MFWAFSVLFVLIQMVFLAWYFNAYMKIVKLRRDEIEYLKNVILGYEMIIVDTSGRHMQEQELFDEMK